MTSNLISLLKYCFSDRFTNGRLLYDRLDEKLEWKHGKTFVPKGNKKLLCFIDDINLGQVSSCVIILSCTVYSTKVYFIHNRVFSLLSFQPSLNFQFYCILIQIYLSHRKLKKSSSADSYFIAEIPV